MSAAAEQTIASLDCLLSQIQFLNPDSLQTGLGRLAGLLPKSAVATPNLGRRGRIFFLAILAKEKEDDILTI